MALESSGSTVTGKVLNGVSPNFFEKVGELGSCKLMRQNNPNCDPACTSGMTCNTAGQCITSPTGISVGKVTITGLTTPLELTAVGSSNQYFNSSLPGDLVDPGKAIELSASGADVSAFVLHGNGIKTLSGVDSTWTFAVGQSTTIKWDADPSNGGTIAINFGLDQHGTTPVQMVCEVEDTGSLTITAEMIKQLADLGTTVPPKGVIERHTVDSVLTDKGCIEFVVRSRISRQVFFATE
jgi:hypothetical protein